jgi:hypothetical protein
MWRCLFATTTHHITQTLLSVASGPAGTVGLAGSIGSIGGLAVFVEPVDCPAASGGSVQRPSGRGDSSRTPSVIDALAR